MTKTKTKTESRDKRVVLVCYVDRYGEPTDQTYSYYTDIPNLEIGEWVVVPAMLTLTCAKIVAVKDISASKVAKATKWIIQKVDLTN